MLADKTLLTMTLAATFVSGSFVGYSARAGREQPSVPADPAVIYAPQLRELESRGYDASEMAEARQAYADYFRGYEYWWNQFLDAHQPTIDKIEEKREKALSALEARFRARAGGK